MPDLLKDLTGGKPFSGPVLLVTQDPVRGFAFERMLNNRGIATVVMPPVDKEQLSRLGSVIRPSALVGFSRDLDDITKIPTIRRQFPPFWPDDHGGGAAGLAMPSFRSPVTIQGNTFSFPGSKGGTVTLPLPPSFAVPTNTWNNFKPWTPPPTPSGPGGVDTKQLEWVFVDKGPWPVMTFYTLSYEPQPEQEISGQR